MVFLGYRFIEEAWINLWPQENQPFGVIKHLAKISLILVFARASKVKKGRVTGSCLFILFKRTCLFRLPGRIFI
jgi:hypothetical protein